jgi:hypothetical protein
MGGRRAGREIHVAVFINNPDAKLYGGPGRAGVLSAEAAQCMVTDELGRVVEAGRNVSVTLIAEDNSKVEFDSMALALFTRQ